MCDNNNIFAAPYMAASWKAGYFADFEHVKNIVIIL